MVNTIDVRKVTQDVLLFLWIKHGALKEKLLREWGLIPEISDELMNNLSVSIWIESFRSQFIWDEFFKKHFKRLTSSSKHFANYFAYASYVLNESANVHECFFDILSIVSEFSLRCLEGNRIKYLNTCVELFCTFFDKELYPKFEDQGGWEKFNEYIRKQYNSIQSKSMINDNESPVILFEYFPEAHKRGNRPDCIVSGVALKKRKQPFYVVNGIVLKDITQKKVETHEKSIRFEESIRSKIEKLVQKSFEELLKDFYKTYMEVKNLHRTDELSKGMKSKEEEWNLVKHSRKKKQVKDHPLQEFQQDPGEIQSKGAQRKDQKSSAGRQTKGGQLKDQKSSGEMKNQEKEGSPQNVLKLSGGMQSKGTQLKEDKKSSGGMQSKGGQLKDPKSSGGMKNQEKEGSSRNVLKPSGGMQSKGTQLKEDKKSSGGMQSKGGQLKDQKSSGEMKNQVKEGSSRKVLKPSGGMQSKEAQLKDQESSGRMKYKVGHLSLNVKEAPKIVSCKSKDTKKELEVKTVTARDPFKTQNFDTISLQETVASVQASHIKLKPKNLEKYKKRLDNMSPALAKLSELIQSLCKQHGV